MSNFSHVSFNGLYLAHEVRNLLILSVKIFTFPLIFVKLRVFDTNLFNLRHTRSLCHVIHIRCFSFYFRQFNQNTFVDDILLRFPG